MLNKAHHLIYLFLLAAAVMLSACGLQAKAGSQAPTPTSTAAPAASPVPHKTEPVKETPASPAGQPAHTGFVLFDKDNGEFHVHKVDGSLTAVYDAPGIEMFPSAFTTSITGSAVYYMMERNLAKNQEPQVLRASSEGVKKVNIPPGNISALAVSADEQWISWGTLGPENGVSELWVSGPDGSEARMVTSARFEQSPQGAFFLRPLEWTADNQLIFERSLTGIGGYILFGGHNSLYRYNPVTSEFLTLVPAEEAHGLCLDSFRLDLQKVTFHCSSSALGVKIRDLNTQAETSLPILEGQGTAGSVQLSPSGAWIAYAIAANVPEDESGKIVTVPADLSAQPQPIVEITGNQYGVVHGWVDENTVLFSRLAWPDSTLWTAHRDGSGAEQVGASGAWVGWLP